MSVSDVQKFNVGTLISTRPTLSTTATTPAASKVSKGQSYFGSKAHSICPNSLITPIDLAQELNIQTDTNQAISIVSNSKR